MNHTENLKLRKPEGGEYYDVEDFNKNSDLLDAAVNSKADKPRFATAGNFPMLDAGGNLGDSGKSASSFAAANHGHDTAYAPIAHVSDIAVHVNAEEKAAIAAVSDKADRTYVDSALSTKVQHIGSRFDVHPTVLSAINACTTDSTFFANQASQLFNAPDRPPIAREYQYFVMMDDQSRKSVIAVTYGAGSTANTISIRCAYMGIWINEWTSLAATKPPQKYDVPIGYGWSRIDGTKYCKSQDGKVTIGLRIGMGGVAIPAGNYTVGMMPEGYRPAPGDDNSGVGTDSSDTYYQGLPVQMWVLSSGGIGVRIPKDIVASPTAGVMGKITYWAAQ